MAASRNHPPERRRNMKKRHRWDDADRCRDCDVRREGYGGGRTGFLCYYRADGTFIGLTAPSCQVGGTETGKGSRR